MKQRIKASILILTAFILLLISAYLNTYYRASEEVLNAVDNIQKYGDILFFEPKGEISTGIIFYPGGKVEYTAYAPLLEACAREGILCALIKMPGNLAVLDINAADGIQEKYPEVKEWYMAGHSLGGSMAASYIAKNRDVFDGLILLAAYSTEDLSSSGLKVLSVYGTKDQVMNAQKYSEYKKFLPTDFREVIIDGGCHAWFGDYGEQEGDGIAEISREEQQKLTVESIKNLIEKN